jgi:hypothetical protein
MFCVEWYELVYAGNWMENLRHFTRCWNRTRCMFKGLHKVFSNILKAASLGVGLTFLVLCRHLPTEIFGFIKLNPVSNKSELMASISCQGM